MPPLLFALMTWFAGTALIVWLDSRPRSTFRTSFRLTGFAAVVAIGVVFATRDASGWQGVYAAFAAAVVVWGWHETGFLMGFVAGPRRTPCPADAYGLHRFRLATETVITHEIALALTALLLFALTWGAANQAAPLAFLLLFVMRLSAKLNLFLGVANLSDEVFPDHLAYLKTYFGRRRVNPLFPISIACSASFAAFAWMTAEAAPAGSVTAVTWTLLAGLAVLGLVEHLFLVLPLKDAKLFAWASSKRAAAAVTTDYVGRR